MLFSVLYIISCIDVRVDIVCGIESLSMCVCAAKNAFCKHEGRCEDHFVKSFLSAELSHHREKPQW